MTTKVMFRTNAKCMGCVSAIKRVLSSIASESSWEFELESADKTMSYVGSVELSGSDIEQVVKLVREAGFRIEKL